MRQSVGVWNPYSLGFAVLAAHPSIRDSGMLCTLLHANWLRLETDGFKRGADVEG